MAASSLTLWGLTQRKSLILQCVDSQLMRQRTQTARDSVEAIPGCLPSLSSLAFLLPVVLLYWQLGSPSSLLTDPSTGVHVRTGDWVLAHHEVPRHGLFSFSLGNKRWCDWEWLSDELRIVNKNSARSLGAHCGFCRFRGMIRRESYDPPVNIVCKPRFKSLP
jgi:hypothetical protein